MSIKLKKISATIAAAFMICGGMLTTSSKVKASGYNPYMQPMGAPYPTYYVAPTAYPTPGVPAYKIPVNQSYRPYEVTIPGPIYLPRNYIYGYIIFQGSRRDFVRRNGDLCYKVGNCFYPVHWI